MLLFWMQIKDGYIAQLTDNTLILKNVGVFYATRCEPVSSCDTR